MRFLLHVRRQYLLPWSMIGLVLTMSACALPLPAQLGLLSVQQAPRVAGSADYLAHARATNNPTHILFDQGENTATVHGVVQLAAKQEYLFHGLAGQALQVALSSLNSQATFAIRGANDRQWLTAHDDRVQQWTGTLPTTQDYLLTVETPSSTPFELVTTLDQPVVVTTPAPAPVRILFAAGSTSTTTQVTAPERHRFLVRAVSGQILRVALTPTDAANPATFAVQGVTDGLPLKRLGDNAQRWSSVLPLTQDYLITVVTPSADVAYTVEFVLQ